MDECGTPVCDTNANCSNTYGSYLCTCVDGYTGNGSQCNGERVSWIEVTLFEVDLSLQILTSVC